MFNEDPMAAMRPLAIATSQVTGSLPVPSNTKAWRINVSMCAESFMVGFFKKWHVGIIFNLRLTRRAVCPIGDSTLNLQL